MLSLFLGVSCQLLLAVDENRLLVGFALGLHFELGSCCCNPLMVTQRSVLSRSPFRKCSTSPPAVTRLTVHRRLNINLKPVLRGDGNSLPPHVLASVASNSGTRVPRSHSEEIQECNLLLQTFGPFRSFAVEFCGFEVVKIDLRPSISVGTASEAKVPGESASHHD